MKNRTFATRVPDPLKGVRAKHHIPRGPSSAKSLGRRTTRQKPDMSITRTPAKGALVDRLRGTSDHGRTSRGSCNNFGPPFRTQRILRRMILSASVGRRCCSIWAITTAPTDKRWRLIPEIKVRVQLDFELHQRLGKFLAGTNHEWRRGVVLKTPPLNLADEGGRERSAHRLDMRGHARKRC